MQGLFAGQQQRERGCGGTGFGQKGGNAARRLGKEGRGRSGGLNGGGESAESEKEEDCEENTVLEKGGEAAGGVDRGEIG